MESESAGKEREHLEIILNIIKNQLNELTGEKSVLSMNARAEKERFWDECPHGIHDFDDVIQLNLQNNIIDTVEDLYAENEKKAARLEKMSLSPYFGRIDIMEEGNSDVEKIYIGAGSLSDKNHRLWICDWRAPICSIFYDCDLGTGSYEAQGKCYRVELLLKRQIKVSNGELIYFYDTDSSVRDDVLAKVLSENTSAKLKVIIASIQKEQNAVIRNANAKNLLIYGPAGSGKTSVGLHRLAYLLYHQRERLKTKSVVVLSGNAIFDSYIANILPDLGEDSVSRYIWEQLV